MLQLTTCISNTLRNKQAKNTSMKLFCQMHQYSAKTDLILKSLHVNQVARKSTSEATFF